MDPVVLTFEAPPSTNELYTGRRFKTLAYKTWIWAAGMEIKQQRPQPVEGPFQLTVWLPGRGDIDNLKAVPDLLVTMGVVEDDRRSLMRRLIVEPSEDGRCRVEIVPL